MSDEKQIDHEDTDEIVCPHCGFKFGNSWEYQSGTVECGDCKREFHCEVDYTVTYTTSKGG
jgi:protein-arginine kinase activator protein McsA